MLAVTLVALALWTPPSPPAEATIARVQALAAELATADPARRAQVEADLLALGPEAVEPLVALLKTAEGAQRDRIQQVLPKFGPAAIDGFYWGSARNRVYGEPARVDVPLLVARMGEAALPELHRYLDAGDEGPRGFAAAVLSRMGKEAVPTVIALMKHPSEEVRRDAVRLLVAFLDPRSVGTFREALADDDAVIRRHAAEGLGHLRDSASADALLSLLEDPEPSARMGAASALGKIYQPRFREPLVRLARTDVNPEVRKEAARTLVRWSDDPAARRLGRRYSPADGPPSWINDAMGLGGRMWLALTSLAMILPLWAVMAVKPPAAGTGTGRPPEATLAVAWVLLLGFLWGHTFVGMSAQLERALLLICVPSTAALMLLAGPTLRWLLAPILGGLMTLGLVILGLVSDSNAGLYFALVMVPVVIIGSILLMPIAAIWLGHKADPVRARPFRSLVLAATAAFYAGFALGWCVLWWA